MHYTITVGHAFNVIIGVIALATTAYSSPSIAKNVDVDVCVYAATGAGINAAIAVRREGKTVVIVEPSRWVGGMLGAGISAMQDCASFEAVGGLTRDMIFNIGRDKPVDPVGRTFKEVHDEWRVPPQDTRRDLLKLLKEHDVHVIYDHRVSRCVKNENTIEIAYFDLAPFDSTGCPPEQAQRGDNLSVTAKMFIDASYDGDLMARSGVSYRHGRESRDEFNESHAGVTELSKITPIDPFIEPGNPNSGLLKWVEDDHKKKIGEGDDYTQAYNFRYSCTTDPKHRVAITPPDNYDPIDYELVGRYVKYLVDEPDDQKANGILGKIFPMKSLSSNYNRKSLISQPPVGVSRLYADGDYATKSRIWKLHQNYLRGLSYFLSTDKRVPESFRNKVAATGLNKLHFPDTNGWPHQLYIRVSRRLNGRYTLSEKDIYNQSEVDDTIAFGLYGIDIYPVRRIWGEDEEKYFVAVEGSMFIGRQSGPTGKPYPIPYRMITPRKEECLNLLVPTCFSATHLGYASARMEPVFMICGESAGIAAAQAIDEGTSVQDINSAKYRESLQKWGQVLQLADVSNDRTIKKKTKTKKTKKKRDN